MAASYPTSVKSFSSKANGDLIDVGHVTDLQDEVVAMETALLGTRAGPLSLAEGRLTLTSATPVTTADVSAATTAYYTPYVGNGISLYDGSSAWAKYTFTEITISLVGLTASKPYDIFAYNSAGTVTIETLVWTNTTTRATALAYQNGVLVKSGATTRRYLGTIFINSSGGQTDDKLLKRFVWNYYNRVDRKLLKSVTTDSWTYTIGTWRQANADGTNQVEAVVGVSEDLIGLYSHIASSNGAGSTPRRALIGVDSTTSPSGDVAANIPGLSWPAGQIFDHWCHLKVVPAVGYHYFAMLENSDATNTTQWYGDAGGGGTEIVSGIVGCMRG